MSEADKKQYEKVKSNPEKYAAYLGRKRAEQRARRAKGVGYSGERKRSWRANQPAADARQRAAHRAVELAVNTGRLVRPKECSDCGTKASAQAHHSSYEREHWLDVEWLCQNCHSQRHK